MKRTRRPREPALVLGSSKDRAELLDAALAAAIAENSAPEKSVRFIHETVVELFNVMEKAGELDFVPTMLQLDEERARAKEEAKRRAQEKKPLPSERYGNVKSSGGQPAGADPTGSQRVQAFLAMQREVIAELESEQMPVEVKDPTVIGDERTYVWRGFIYGPLEKPADYVMPSEPAPAAETPLSDA